MRIQQVLPADQLFRPFARRAVARRDPATRDTAGVPLPTRRDHPTAAHVGRAAARRHRPSVRHTGPYHHDHPQPPVDSAGAAARRPRLVLTHERHHLDPCGHAPLSGLGWSAPGVAGAVAMPSVSARPLRPLDSHDQPGRGASPRGPGGVCDPGTRTPARPHRRRVRRDARRLESAQAPLGRRRQVPAGDTTARRSESTCCCSSPIRPSICSPR